MRVFTHFEQHSLQWLAVRAGLITASEADALLTPLFKIKDSKAVDTYLAKKLAERWLGGPLPSFKSTAMEFGSILESSTVNFIELQLDTQINRVALVTDDNLTIGASPDGLIGEDGGVEIKCPNADTHIKYLLANVVPPDYIVQVHFSMYVTGRQWWKFVSYRHGLPMLVKIVERDEAVMETTADAVEGFLAKLETAYTALVHLNNGVEPSPNLFRADAIAGKIESTTPEPTENFDTPP